MQECWLHLPWFTMVILLAAPSFSFQRRSESLWINGSILLSTSRTVVSGKRFISISHFLHNQNSRFGKIPRSWIASPILYEPELWIFGYLRIPKPWSVLMHYWQEALNITWITSRNPSSRNKDFQYEDVVRVFEKKFSYCEEFCWNTCYNLTSFLT